MLVILMLMIVGLINGYWLIFSIWMCAHPVYQGHYWQLRFYAHLTISILLCVDLVRRFGPLFSPKRGDRARVGWPGPRHG